MDRTPRLALLPLIPLLIAAWGHGAAAARFSHATYDSLLARIVTTAGLVDYPRLLEASSQLDRYMAALAERSPISDPDDFADRDEVLAYWLNAYNACVLRGIADHYPIDSVGDIEGGLLGRVLRLADDTVAFFLVLRFELGGERMNLFYLEHGIVRSFGEPRIHFALNCGARGCPPLRGEAYTGDRLEAQLADQTRRFFERPRGLRIEDGQIVVSPILSWFRPDFETWMEREHPERPATVRAYLELVSGQRLPPAATLRFGNYDWRLNDASRAPAAGAR
ncbi:MAG: DUF547 domain-containing protein [Candidatus Eiseniibacteriota bacterium]|jgi:hypothetical protein